jgi:hypothetical protein
MSRRAFFASLLAFACVCIALFAGAYTFAKSKAPDKQDAARTKRVAEESMLRRGRAANERKLEKLRLASGGPAAQRGKKAGTGAGEQAGQQIIAARGAESTPLPLPVLPTSLYDQPPTGFTERPTEIVLGNHEILQNISWSTWGDTGHGTGTLLGVICEPSCAEGPPTHDPATIEATEPSFTPENKRYFSKVHITSANNPPIDLDVNLFPGE